MSWGGLCLAETARKSSIVAPRVAEVWMCAMAVLPSLGSAGRKDATEESGSGHPGNHSLGYSVPARVSAGPGGDLAAVAQPELGQYVLYVVLGRPLGDV